MRVPFRTALLIAILLCLFPIVSVAQGVQTGGVTGVVRDSSGAVLTTATVEIYNETTGLLERRTTTGADGTYTAMLLRPGAYRVEISAPNFKTYRAVSVMVRLDETTRQDAVLAVGVPQEMVTVEAVSTLVNTESATTGQPIDRMTLSALPLPTPNLLFLLSLSPGTSGEPGDVRTAGRGAMDINVNGQRTTNNSYSLEGINVNDFNRAHFDFAPLPNPNAVQEFKVATSLYDATSGSKGGGALGVSLRTGTKDLHWSGYWQNRNDAFNATEWFTKFNANPSCKEYTLASKTCPKGRLAQNVVGGSGSGPVPGLGGVIFGNYQTLRARNGVDTGSSTSQPTVPAFPTSADGSTSAALLSAQYGIPLANIDPVAVNILNLKNSYWGGTYVVPRPGQPGCGTATAPGNFRCLFQKVAKLTENQFTITYDRGVRGDKDKLGVRWFYADFLGSLPYWSGGSISYPSQNDNHNKFITTSYTTQISNRSLNEFRFGFNRFKFIQAPNEIVKLSDIGAVRPNMAEIPGMYSISVTGLFSVGIGANDDQGVVSNTFYWSDTYSRVFSQHTLRIGGEASRYQLNRYNRFVTRGSLGFGTIGTSQPFQNFLQGRSTSLQVANGDPMRYFRAKDIALFVQDDWRIFPNLTLNVGLRWEGVGYTKEKFNRMATYVPELALANKNPFAFPESLNFEGFTGNGNQVPDCMMATCFDTNNWAPRIGFAWDMFGDKKTVLRGGYGIYYQRISNQTVLQTSLAPPFTVQAIDNRPDGNPSLILANPWPNFPGLVPPQQSRFAGLVLCPSGTPCRSTNTPTTNANDPTAMPVFVNDGGQPCMSYPDNTRGATNCAISTASFTTPPQGFYTPYNQQWNLTLQREILRGWAVEAGYVGAHYVGGIGIYTPYPRLASPGNPITVRDINGVSYTITANTANNEPLRHAVLGLSRKAGARFAGNVGFALYHSGQVTVSHRFDKGLFFQAGYTFSKTIDNVSGSMGGDELNVTRNGQGGANFWNLAQIDPRLSRTIGDFDRPHRLSVSYSYDLPVPKTGIWGGQAFQGWALSGTTYFQSGLPFTITGTGGGAYGLGNSTPMLICAPLASQIAALPGCTPGAATTVQQAILPGDIQQRVNNYLNPNMFINPGSVPNGAGSGATDFGNVPRNAYRGPFQQNFDMSVQKRFRVTEKHAVSFRADFFNAFNHPVFRAPGIVSIGTRSTFGQINNTAVPARLIQFGLKYEH